MEKIINIIYSLFELNKDDEYISIPSEIIGIIEDNPIILESINNEEVINFINDSKNKYYKELELLIEANHEQTSVLCQLELEAQEKARLHKILEEKNKNLNINLEKEKRFNLLSQKQSRIFIIVQWLIIIIIVIIALFGINMFVHNSDQSVAAFKDIVLLIIGLASGSISTFIGTSRLDRDKKDEL